MALSAKVRISNLVYYGMSNNTTCLQQGMLILVGDKKYRVERVNECRAYCVPARKHRVIIKDKVFNKVRQFMATGSAINISPNSDCRIVRA